MHKLIPLLLATASLGALAERGHLIDLNVEDRDGRAYREFHQQRQAWIAGEQGEPYQISLHNNSNERVLVVLSVDGVNAISGERASFQQAGYVLAPYGETVVRGWRKSLGSVAQFYFTRSGDSYAARTDRPFDVGVIGAAVFRERPQPPVVIADRARRPIAKGVAEESAAPPPAPAPSLGTGHGPIEDDPARRTVFARASDQPGDVVTIRYDNRRNLIAAGIVQEPRWRERPNRSPNPFPEQGFTPDPPRAEGYQRRWY